ncbi:MAG TPA: hypothetical protein DCY89_05665, partial [Gammaproteobacteria bacterium]|nr:hypothetical protein [Gammaproteobacteria bacterium]
MPNRIIRDAILDSERYHSVPPLSRLAYLELLLCADDYGLVPLSPVYLRRHTTWADGLSDAARRKVLTDIADHDLIRCYAVGGAEFAYVPRFGNVPRSVKPKWPAPPPELCGNEINNLMQKMRSRCVADAQRLHTNAPETETET